MVINKEKEVYPELIGAPNKASIVDLNGDGSCGVYRLVYGSHLNGVQWTEQEAEDI